MTEPKRDFLDPSRVAEFWNQARRGADEDQQTGYLQDEWPAALAQRRLEGEWAQVRRWLDAHRVPRGACLDVGCGVGAWLERFAARFDHAEGIDLSSEMVASAKARLQQLGFANVDVSCRSALDLPDDRRYDFIFVGGVLMYLNDDVVEEMVGKLRRMLSPGGLLLLRESTSTPRTWYRDTPLSPGLFAKPGASRPPYYAIYRTPPSYREMAERQALAVVRWVPNRHYKVADLTESWLTRLNWLLRGRLARRRASAERAARWIHRLRWLTLLPQYYLTRTFAPRTWRINNYWYLCAPAPASAAPGARSS
jgi:2-polyprenyl-3-methyl-5-hydroxy-6-metoxy-1,4-benzoquinol methylase